MTSPQTSDEQEYSEHYGVAMYDFKAAAIHIEVLCQSIKVIDTKDAQAGLMDTIAKLARASIELEQRR